MRALAATLLVLSAACGGGARLPAAAPSPAKPEPTIDHQDAIATPSAFPLVRLTPRPTRAPTAVPPAGDGRLELRAGSRTMNAEVADEPEERQVGLMNRDSMPENDGMLFVFPGPHRGRFWMKNTRIPLAIAFMRSDGDRYVVVDIQEMEPCRTEECPTYGPGADYDAALEANKGWYDRAGVRTGDQIIPQGPRPTATA